MNGVPHNAQTIAGILQQEMLKQADTGTWQVSGPIFSTVASKIFLATNEPGKDHFAVKCTSPQEAKEQFYALQMTAKLLEDMEHCASPAPIALFERDGILLMDWVDGQSFQDMCLARGPSRRTIEFAIVQCAEMLAALHRPSQIRSNILDTADFLNDIDIAINGRVSPRFPRPALTFLQESAGEIAQEALPVTILHGDFKPANLLIKSPDIFTIDAAMKWEGATVHDAAHFLNQFALDLYHPRAWRLRSALNSYEALFLTTYETQGGSISRRALQWLRLQKLIILYTEHRHKNSIASRYLVICLRLEIHRVIKESGG